MMALNSEQLTAKRQKYINAGTIWAFWDGDIPDLVLRCIETVRTNNTSRPVVILNKSSLDLFLDESDYPSFYDHAYPEDESKTRPGTPDDFSAVQYLADWVRIVLLEKYGGVWFDASVICTNSVESWISSTDTHITMFPMHANDKVHGNWTMAVSQAGHPLLKAWREDFANVLKTAGPNQLPTDFCEQAFEDYPALNELWYGHPDSSQRNPKAPPLPYLWVYLVLQCTLQKNPQLRETIFLRPSIDGPMYRRYMINIEEGIDGAEVISEKTAHHLGSEPLNVDDYDRFFVKLVGKDRAPIQDKLDRRSFREGSALDSLSQVSPRPIRFGSLLKRSIRNLSFRELFNDSDGSMRDILHDFEADHVRRMSSRSLRSSIETSASRDSGSNSVRGIVEDFLKADHMSAITPELVEDNSFEDCSSSRRRCSVLILECLDELEGLEEEDV